MSRQRDLIAKRARELGLTDIKIHWEPIGIAMEMCGPGGGWLIQTDEETFAAYNYREAIKQMEDYVAFEVAKQLAAPEETRT